MDQPSLSSPAEATQPRVSDEEVEDLLGQAEVLSAAIVEGVNAEGTDESPAGVIPVQQPQPGSDEVQDVSDKAQAEARDEHADGDLNDLLNDPDLASPDVESESSSQEAPRTPPISEQAALEGGAPAVEPVDNISLPPAPLADHESPPEKVVPDDDEAEENLRPEADAPERAEVSPRPITQRLATIPGAALSAVKTAPIALVDAILEGIIYLDRPFAGLPTHIKRALGVAAIAIILTAIAVWMLPELLERNPFADMTPYTATDG